MILMLKVKYQDLDETQKSLLEKASKEMEKAFNQVSNFYVGAALLTVKGDIVCGSNFESTAHTPTICAERSALVTAHNQGHKAFQKIAIIARGKDFDTENVTGPCGVCRQLLFEASQIFEHDLEVIMSNTKKEKIIISTISELLPLAFGPKDLGINLESYRKNK